MDRRQKFVSENLASWERAIKAAAGPIPPDSASWRGRERIRTVLRPFMGDNRNHAHYPTGGGMDWSSVEKAAEAGCLVASVSGGFADLFKPCSLTLEHFPKSPGQSFLLLELDALPPCGADEPDPRARREEVLEHPPGTYLSRELWERGYMRIDEDGREVPLPRDSRPVTRWLGGKVLIVMKGSLWNGDPATYDGQHDAMTADQIREAITKSLKRRDS